MFMKPDAKIRFYTYRNCDTCRKASAYLRAAGVDFSELPIVETPPTVPELKRMLRLIEASGGTFRNLFNTSGQLYRELRIAQKLKDGMTPDEAIALLAKNGKLIKRPFLLLENAGVVGFRETDWARILLQG